MSDDTELYPHDAERSELLASRLSTPAISVPVAMTLIAALVVSLFISSTLAGHAGSVNWYGFLVLALAVWGCTGVHWYLYLKHK
jgi:hypothetical protein